MDKNQRIDELVKQLNEASEAYYGSGNEVLSNYEWDAMFDELAALEAETGYILEDSPTQNVSTSEEEVSANGVKEPHEFPALSLQKSKKVADIQKWAGEKDIWCSLKLDGCTCVATYDAANDGTGESVLTKFMTRGDGITGTNITYLAPAILSLPQKIPNGGHVVVRGETLIRNDDFTELNAMLGDDEEQYANARNFAGGTLSLDASRLEDAKSRKCRFVAFNLIYMEQEENSWGNRMSLLDSYGFETVPRSKCLPGQLQAIIDEYTKKVESGAIPYPVDGLVITFEDWAYANSGGSTGHHSRNGGFAYKWPDESKITTLDHVEWSCAAGSITPVAVFDPVQLEGTTVSRASLCNISEMERLGIGENRKTKLEIIKANKIIPKCVSVLEKVGTFAIPEFCPACLGPVEVRVSKQKSRTKTLHCTNPHCPAKHLKQYARAVGKNALDIDGLSIKALLQFINFGFMSELADLYHLDAHADEICALDGFGQRSWEKLWAAIQKSKTSVSAEQFLYALNIPLVGRDVSKRLIQGLGFDDFMNRLKDGSSFEDIANIGPEKTEAIRTWYRDSVNREQMERLLAELTLTGTEKKKADGACVGKTFVITGTVNHFTNRDAFKAWVENHGGKVAGSVSKKTTYLVNNDTASTSGKNQKAKELGIPIISEAEFMKMFGVTL